MYTVLNFLYLLIFVYIVILGRLVSIQKTIYIGGRLDPEQLLKSLVNKYADDGSHIEVEIKLKEVRYFNKILQWIKEQKHTAENTVNRIWHVNGKSMIETSNLDSIDDVPRYSSKKRLFKYDMHLGRLTASLENDLNSDYTTLTTGEPAIIRVKRRLSANINDRWRVDYTRVNVADAQMSVTEIVRISRRLPETVEVEFEYIGKDVEGSISSVSELDRFIRQL